MSSHCSPRIAIANCEQWYIIFCIFSIFLNKLETWNLNLVPTPLPPFPQLPPGSAIATTKRGAALLEVKTIIFLHNLHETDKSLVPSGGNALVLINRKGRRDVSCKSGRNAQRTNQKRPMPRGPWGDLAHFTKPLRFDKQFVQWATNSGLLPSNYWAQR